MNNPQAAPKTDLIRITAIPLGLAAAVLLYLTTYVNYLLFHTLVELFSIVVAFGVFIIAWHSRRFIKNPYLLMIGLAYLFIGFLDLLHTLAYKGMPIFTDYDYYANQLWIGARFMESISLLVGFLYLRLNRPINTSWVLAIYSVVTALLILSIFTWKIFPECFVEGQGLTPFKKISEYIICLILLSALYLLHHSRDRFEPRVYKLVFWSIICTGISELAFTFYVSNYGFSNLVGHYFKLISFVLVYFSFIKTGMQDPYTLIFKELNTTNQKLSQEIILREQSEEKREKLILELKGALDEIKTLQGILPICANCKKIRDDTGYWNQIEKYISEHSGATFSHGICPDCMAELYPGT
jgi:hypothetical protein